MLPSFIHITFELIEFSLVSILIVAHFVMMQEGSHYVHAYTHSVTLYVSVCMLFIPTLLLFVYTQASYSNF